MKKQTKTFILIISGLGILLCFYLLREDNPPENTTKSDTTSTLNVSLGNYSERLGGSLVLDTVIPSSSLKDSAKIQAILEKRWYEIEDSLAKVK